MKIPHMGCKVKACSQWAGSTSLALREGGSNLGPCVYGYFLNRVSDSRNGRVSGYPKIER